MPARLTSKLVVLAANHYKMLGAQYMTMAKEMMATTKHLVVPLSVILRKDRWPTQEDIEDPANGIELVDVEYRSHAVYVRKGIEREMPGFLDYVTPEAVRFIMVLRLSRSEHIKGKGVYQRLNEEFAQACANKVKRLRVPGMFSGCKILNTTFENDVNRGTRVALRVELTHVKEKEDFNKWWDTQELNVMLILGSLNKALQAIAEAIYEKAIMENLKNV